MRLGMFPGQLDALRELARKGVDAERRSRRQFLFAVFATLAAGVGAFYVGRAVGSRSEDGGGAAPGDARERWQKKLEWADAFASQPLEELLARRSTFLMTIEMTGGSESTWRGFARLAEHSLANPNARRDDFVRLNEVIMAAPPPDSLSGLVERIGEAMRR